MMVEHSGLVNEERILHFSRFSILIFGRHRFLFLAWFDAKLGLNSRDSVEKDYEKLFQSSSRVLLCLRSVYFVFETAFLNCQQHSS